MTPRRILGYWGERTAERFLRRLGHRPVARNFRCAYGEIDLVTIDGDTIVFVEVKTRGAGDTAADGPPNNSPVHHEQWRRLERAAEFFLRRHANAGACCRFDVVTVERRGWWRRRVEHFDNVHPFRA